jgi:AAA15 family ATPase/GTPase
VNAKDGLLLIDEFENGMHHTVQTDVWRAVFRLARSLNTQVVATSHSWDSIEAFQKAASEDQRKGSSFGCRERAKTLFRLYFAKTNSRRTRDRIEVR